VVVDGDATATGALGVSLALGATDALAGVTDMRLANEAAPSGAWEPFATSKTWSLSAGDGIKTVYAQFRDAAGNESPAVSDTIFLDTNAPTGTVTIDGGAAEATSIDVAVDLSAADGAGTGVTEMRLSNDGTNWAAWMPFAPATPWTLQPGTGVRSVYAQFRDAVGNASATVSDDILLTTPDLTPPSGTVAIDGDAAFANRLSVTLSLSASDDRGGPVEMCVSNDAGSCAVWEPFAATKAWALLPGDGTKTVYVRFRDDAGNVSAPVSDGITLDTVPPSVAIAAVLTPTNRDVQQIGGTAEAGAVVTVAVDTGGTVGPIARPTPTSWTSSVSGLVLGTNTLTATATDAAGNAAQAQAQIARVANSLPAPIADALALDEDTSGTSQVQPNDPDGLDTHTYAVETSPLHGSASVSATGLVSYSPAADYHGPDAVVVRVTDSLGGSATATVDVSVSPVNDAPSAQAGTLTTAEDTPGSGSLAAVDVDGDPLTFSLVTGPSAGSVSLDPATGSYTYTPLPNASGADGFTFRASDGTADSVAAVTVTVTPVNDPPTASVAPLGIDEDTSGTAQVQVSDPDAGDSHTYAITVPPARGTAGVSAAGLVTYTPAADDHGSYSFTLEVRDAAGAGAMAVVDITVTPVNDAPVLASIGGKAVTEEDSLGFTVSGTDVDGDSLTYTASGLPDGASFDGATATFAWSPAAGQAGSYSVTFTVTDGQAQDSETVSISVAPLSVPPPSSDSGGGGGGGCFLSTLGD
jgi:VCBS repeat-containing protein